MSSVQYYTQTRARSDRAKGRVPESEEFYVEEYHRLPLEEKILAQKRVEKHRIMVPLAKDWAVAQTSKMVASRDKKIRVGATKKEIMMDTLFLILENSMKCFYQPWHNRDLNHMKILTAFKQVPSLGDLGLFRLGFFDTATSTFSYEDPKTKRLTEIPKAIELSPENVKVSDGVKQFVMDVFVASYIRQNQLKWGNARTNCLADFALFTPRAKKKWPGNYQMYEQNKRAEPDLARALIENLSVGKAVVVHITDCVAESNLHAIFGRIFMDQNRQVSLEYVESHGRERFVKSTITEIEMMWDSFLAKYFNDQPRIIEFYGIKNVDNNIVHEDAAENACWYTATVLTVCAAVSGLSAQRLAELFAVKLHDKQWWVNFVVFFVRNIVNELQN